MLNRPQSKMLNHANVLLHVGYHKCASTYLQRQVFPLLDQDYLPLAGYESTIIQRLNADDFRPEEFAEWAAERIGTPSAARPDRWLIVSHEQLSGHPLGYAEIDAGRIARNLHATFPTAKILIVVRNQFDYMRSVYAFRVAVHGQESRSYENFVREEGPAGLYRRVEYDRFVTMHAEIFGRENMLVLPLEMLKHDRRGFVSQLHDQLRGISIPDPHDTIVNPSTQLESVAAIWRTGNRAFARLHPLTAANPTLWNRSRNAYYKIKRRTTPVLNDLLKNSDRLQLSPRLREELTPRFEASNGRLQPFVPCDLRQLAYPMPHAALSASPHQNGASHANGH